jgi:hypothetical protein
VRSCLAFGKGGWDCAAEAEERTVEITHVLTDCDKKSIHYFNIRDTFLIPISLMPLKRRRSSADSNSDPHVSKRLRTIHPQDRLSALSNELLIRILHNLPITTLIQVQRLSHRFYILAGDSQIWKNLYYNRFVLPRALRIPGIKSSPSAEEALHFSSRRSKWLEEKNTLVNRVDGKKTNWKAQFKLRHNWSVGACEVEEIHVADRPSVPSMLVRLAEGVVFTADTEEGLRAWDLKEKKLIARCELEDGEVPTCLAIDEQDAGKANIGIAMGFLDGGWGTWKLDITEKVFVKEYRHPESSNGALSAVAYANPYVLTITESQLLSLYSFTAPPPPPEMLEDLEDEEETLTVPAIPEVTESSSQEPSTKPRLVACLKSHTSWPPPSLSIRTTSSAIIASIAYSLPTYFSGYTVGLQELHLSPDTGLITFSRLTSALPQGFQSLLSSSSPSSSPSSGTSTPTSHTQNPGIGSGTRPTTLSYSHPYILATHPDNTLTLYLCTSTSTSLTITPGTKLWGHTSSVSSAEITPRGKAVSVSTRGNELRVWELEGGLSALKKRSLKASRLSERSVQIRENTEMGREEIEDSKRWVGFDDEMVIVLKESGRGTQALMVYDFT